MGRDGGTREGRTGRHAGRHAGPPAATGSSGSSTRLVLPALGVVALLVAWGVLVHQAIVFGAQARDAGGTTEWAFAALATLGAIACLLLVLVLGHRLLHESRRRRPPAVPDPTRSRPPGGHRAGR